MPACDSIKELRAFWWFGTQLKELRAFWWCAERDAVAAAGARARSRRLDSRAGATADLVCRARGTETQEMSMSNGRRP